MAPSPTVAEWHPLECSQALTPGDVGLILSYQCQSACQHCLYNCGPGWKEWMDPADIPLALDAIQSFGERVQVHITGGEPFLNYPLLLQTVQMAVRMGILVYVETNAGWCLDSHQVYDRFQELADSGLAAVLISCTPFHAERIPLTRTLRALDLALRIFGPQRVLLYQAQWIDALWRFGTHDPIPLATYIDAYGSDPAGVMLWDGFGLLSGGRAGYRLGHLTNRRPPAAFAGKDCRQELLNSDHSHFDLYGNFIPGFCGGISLGSWRSLSNLLPAYLLGDYPPLLRTLIESGPFGLFKLACLAGFSPLPGGYAGKCHLCVDVRRFFRTHFANQPESSLFLPSLQPADFYQFF